MNTKKQIACVLSATVIMFSAVAPGAVNYSSLCRPVTAYAASQSAGTVSAMSIPDSDIKFFSVNMTEDDDQPIEFSSKADWKYEPPSKTYNCPRGKLKEPLSITISTYTLNRQTIHCVLTVPNNSELNTAEKIKKLVTISVTHSNGSKYAVSDQFGLEVEKDEKSSSKRRNVYILKSTIISYYGESDVALHFDSKLKEHDVSVSKCTLSAADKGYSYSTVTDGKGQRLHIAIQKTKDVSDARYDEWLRSLGRYISSLSDITSIEYKDIYVIFDDPTVVQPTSCCDYRYDAYGQADGILIKFPKDTSSFYCKQISAGKLDWGIIHEISHAYSRLNGISRSYELFNTAGDEGLVNVRALTAIQNCSQLKNKGITINGMDLGNYMHAMRNSADSYKSNALFDQLYIYDKYGNSFSDGWAVIEKIMLGQYGEMSSAALNGAIEFVNEADGYEYGSSIRFDTRDTLRFINVLYTLCINHPEFGPSREDFKRFLSEFAGIGIFAHYYNERTRNSNYYIKNNVFSDINGDRIFNADDLQALKDFVSGSGTLAPEGVYQADYNQDGYVNEKDAADLEDMWF